MGAGALHHRDVDVMLPECGGDIVGRVVGADDHRALAGIGVRSGMPGGVVLVAIEPLHPWIVREVRLAGHAGGEHQLPGAQRDLAAVPRDDHGPLLRRLVVARPFAGRGSPVIELHDLGVHLEPVADLVLGREDRPVRWKRQIGQVVVPDRIMEAERLVALAPAIAGALVELDDDGRHAEHAAAWRRARCRPGRRR